MDKTIISDTSCLIALENIGLLYLLKDLFQEVLITREVKEEFGNSLPDWIIVSKVNNKKKIAEIALRLDIGEASSIVLALELDNVLLIIDEVKGRNVAKSLNIEIIGTIGILLIAYDKGLINDFLATIRKLMTNGFRVSDVLVEKLTEKYGK
jgi:predicted nucleic acid-binding protein